MLALRLTCSTFYVDLRLLELNRRWIASADPRRSEPRVKKRAIEAVEHALQPFDGVVNELLASRPSATIS